MKKFLFLYYGRSEPTPEVSAAWKSWFATVGGSLVDSGSPLVAGRVITAAGANDAATDVLPAVGYSIVNAQDMDAAEKLLDGCPFVNSVQIYEALPM